MVNIEQAIPDIDPITLIQIQLYNDWNHRFYICPSGRRSRKTLIFLRKLLIQALKNSYHYYFLGAPTDAQAEAIFWRRAKAMTRPFWAKRPRETQKTIYLRNGSEIEVHGLDKPERVEGRPWHGAHITEVDNCKPDMWDEHIEPCFEDTQGFAYLDGVPEGGRGWYYKLALYASGGVLPKEDPRLQGAFADNGEWCYYHWKSATVLDPASLARRAERLDPRTYAQEWDGSFESVGGAAYYRFSEDNIRRCVYDPELLVHVGMDFNVNPMTATLNHIYIEEKTGRDVVMQFGEIWLEDSNTPQMAAELKRRFKKPERVIIYPDATGGARSQTGNKSNHQILRDEGFTLKFKSTNPEQTDRLAAVNSMLKSKTGFIGWYIDPCCKHTIEDLNQVIRHDDGRIVEAQGKEKLTHISSAQGYFIAYKYPVHGKGRIELLT